MHGGTTSNGRSWTCAVLGVYWMSWIRSFSNTTLPGLVATLRPTSKAVSSVIDTRPLAKSSMNRRVPSTRLAPPLSSAACKASGLVARQLAGLRASTTWRSTKPHWALLRSSSGAVSSVWRSSSDWLR